MTDYDLQDRRFWLANENEIKEGRTTDMYFVNTKEVLQKNNVDADVVMEVYARELPYPQNWGILTGVYEAAKLLHLKASGTMPHALIQVVGDQESAWKMYDKTIASDSPRVALVDTFWDEKTEAVKAFEVLGSNLWGVRLDTPASRRGDFRKIIEEVRWELDIRGGEKVKLIASGRLDEESVGKLKDIADGFEVGTAVAYPPVIDLSAKIVEVGRGAKREFRAKRGGLGGRKAVYRSSVGFQDTVVLEGADAPPRTKAMLTPLLKNGKIVRKYEGVEAIRSRVLRDLHMLSKHPPSISW